MPFREKMKRAFGRSPSTSDGSDLAKTSSKGSKKDQDNVYKPGEMPKPKYRGPYNQSHQDKLSAFSFGGAWARRKSDQSQYSPMGSRLPSRRGSMLSGRSPEARSRQQSYVGQVVENADGDDDNIANVGLAQQLTVKENARPLSGHGGLERATYGDRVHGDAHNTPFKEDELTLALTKTRLNFQHTANGANWALTGGIAMQKYGMTDRTTQDSDIVVSILPLAITNAAAADANIQYPPALMAASGTVTLFVNIDGQQVKNDVFPSNSDLAPSLDNTVTIDDWPIVSILSLVKSKVQRAENKDITDVAWLCENRLNDVTAIASQIDYQSRLSFASDAKASNSKYFDDICQGLQLDPSQVPSK